MLQITNHTTKREFLQMLTDNAGKPGKLYVEVLSLPSFLNTQVAFTIFNYQISNYPRTLSWVTEDQKVLEFLRECKAEIGQAGAVTLNESNPLANSLATVPGVVASVQDAVQIPEAQISHLATLEPKNAIELVTPALSNEQFEASQTAQDEQETLENKQNFKFPSFRGVKFKAPLTVDDLFKGNFYEPSSLLNPKTSHASSASDSENEIPDASADQTSQAQNLDSWLEKIAATKVALHSLRDQTKAETAAASQATWSKARPKSMYLLAGSLAFSLIFVGFLALFPTKAYTLEVHPSTEQTSQTLEWKVGEFSKKTVKLTAQSQTNASGKKEVPTDRAIGKVSLINPSAGDVDLNNGQFRLLSDDKQYEAISNPTLPSTFAIPARNNLNGPSIEINVQARQSGAEYNLPENSRFTIVNLLGQRVCGSCYGVSVSEIKNSDFSGQRIVSDADYSLLRSSTEGDLAQKRIDEIKNIQDEQVFTNINWYRNLDSAFKFDKNIGDIADAITLKQDVSTNLYYLSQNTVEQKLKSQNSSIDKISDLALAETTGTFESDENTIKIKLFYTFSKAVNINKEDIVKTLNNKDCNTAQNDLRNSYPDVKSLECKDLGLKMPGVPTRVDLNIVNKQ